MYYKMIVRYLPIKKNQQKYKNLWSSNLHVVIFVLLLVLQGSHKQQQQQQQQRYHIATHSNSVWPTGDRVSLTRVNSRNFWQAGRRNRPGSSVVFCFLAFCFCFFFSLQKTDDKNVRIPLQAEGQIWVNSQAGYSNRCTSTYSVPFLSLFLSYFCTF